MIREDGELKIGIVLNYVNMAMGNLIPLFYTPVMLSLLGQSEYGLYKLASSVTGYLSLISLGIGSALTRFLIKANSEGGKEEEEKTLGLFVIMFRWIAVACCILGIGLALSLGIWYGESLSALELQRMKILSLIMVANMSLSFVMTPYMTVVSTHERFLFLQCMNIVLTTIGPIANIIVLYMGFASIGMAVSSLVISFLARVVYYYYVKNELHITANTKEAPTGMLGKIINFSIWIFVAEIVGKLYGATDIFLIGMIPALATVGVAVYSVGGVFNGIVFSLATGVSSLIAPKVNKMVFSGATNSEVTDLCIKVGRIQGLIFSLFCTGFICFGKPFIDFYVGNDYADAYWIAIVMLIPNSIPLVQSTCLNVVIAKNQHKFRSLMYLGIAIANVIGTWLLLPKWGIIGAAVMTGLALIVGQGFVMNWYYWKKTGIEIGRFWMSIGRVYIIPVIMCVGTLVLAKYIDFYKLPILIAGILVYAVIFMGVQYCVAMNDYEKGLIIEQIKKLFHKK